MKELTKEQFDELLKKSQSLESAKVSDLIQMLKPFEDYYITDPNCHYCGGELRLIGSKESCERIKYPRDLINIYDLNEDRGSAYDLHEFLTKNKS